MAGAKRDSNDARQKEQESEHIGEEEGAGGWLAENHDPEGNVENTQKDLPYEVAPSLRPEGLDDFEAADGNGGKADEYPADGFGKGDVAQDEYSCQDQSNSEQYANPVGRHGEAGRRSRSAVMERHVILLEIFERPLTGWPIHRPRRAGDGAAARPG